MRSNQIHPRSGLILVRRYTRPERYSEHILINPAWAKDMNRSIWEVVVSTPAADRKLGMRLKADDIIWTPPNRGVYVDCEDGEFFLIDSAEVMKCLRYKDVDDTIDKDALTP